MDKTLLVVSLVVTLLFVALSTYFLFFHSRQSSGAAIYLVGPSKSGKTALWSYVNPLMSAPPLTAVQIRQSGPYTDIHEHQLCHSKACITRETDHNHRLSRSST